MAWFLRKSANISEKSQKEMPDGLWTKCPGCSAIIYRRELEDHLFTCPKCNHHFRIGSSNYVDILFDEGSWTETHAGVISTDPLNFVDTRPYSVRLAEAYSKTHLPDAVTTGTGTIGKARVSFGCMNFGFVGGSMGSVVGEKFYRAARFALTEGIPLVFISASGGARMQESALSLMQMAKTSTILTELSENRIPYISLMTDPTTGGVSASFAMLGDILIGEPGALIGFAGPRVIEQTIRKKLPEGFQRSEFLLKHGFLDLVVHRRDLKSTLSKLLGHLGGNQNG